jgi:hypothetical protein
MAESNRVALYKSLVTMISKKGKKMDKALYALNELTKKEWRLNCISPATKEIIKESFNIDNTYETN